MAETMPRPRSYYRYEAGELRLADLPIAAGLWALDGAALDTAGGWWYPGPDRKAWQELIRREGVRVIRVELTGTHVEAVPTLLRQPWVDHSEAGMGRHYAAGEVAPMPTVVFHLRCSYETRNAGGATVRQSWVQTDAEDWLHRWHKPGNEFLVIPAVFNDRVNKLRNVIRDRHSMAQRLRMPEPERSR